MIDGAFWKALIKRVKYGLSFRSILLLFAVFGIYSAFLGWYSQQIVWDIVRAEHAKPVKRLQNGALSIYRSNGRDGLISFIRERTEPRKSQDTALLLAAPDGRIIAGNLSKWPSNLDGNEQLSFGYVTVLTDPQKRYMAFSAAELTDGSRLLTGVPVLSHEELASLHTHVLLVSLVVAAFLAIASGFMLRLLTESYFADFKRVVSKGAQGDFHERIQLSGSGDWLDGLFSMMNRSLDRIEPMVAEMRIVTTGVAHDVRSPISRIRFAIERAMLETQEKQTAQSLEKTLEDIDQLLSMLSKTMEIAQAQSNTTRQRFEDCRVDQILRDMALMYQPYAEERGFKMIIDDMPPITLSLHRHLFEKACSNIIENAIDYAEDGNSIWLTARKNANEVEITIADNGAGIPEHRYQDAIRRYGRLDPGRNITGTGLGLTIVDAVVRMHGGRMRLSSNQPGLCVTLNFPVDEAQLSNP